MMTRCKAFYRKMKSLRDDPEVAAEFCEKESDVIKKIYAHIDFMDKHFPNWLDDDLDDTNISIKEPLEETTLSETATRPLRSLKKTNPEVFEEVLSTVCEFDAPTTKDVERVIQHAVPPRPAKFAGCSVESYIRLFGQNRHGESTHEETHEYLTSIMEWDREEWKKEWALYNGQIVRGGSLTDIMIWFVAGIIKSYESLYKDYIELKRSVDQV